MFHMKKDFIFMQMNNIYVTYIFIPIVSHKDSFCHRGKGKLGIGLFIHELLREPLIYCLFEMMYCNYEILMRNANKTLLKKKPTS